MQRQLRRWQNTLVISGMAVVLFGVWSVIKVVLYFTIGQSELKKMMKWDTLGWDTLEGIIDPAVAEVLVLCFVFFFMIVACAIALAVRIYIGRSARAEGMGRKKGRVYLVVAAVVMLYDIFSVFSGVNVLRAANASVLDTVVSMLVDATSAFNLGEMIVAAVWVKRLTKELSGQE